MVQAPMAFLSYYARASSRDSVLADTVSSKSGRQTVLATGRPCTSCTGGPFLFFALDAFR
jgi:hypothetical protein